MLIEYVGVFLAQFFVLYIYMKEYLGLRWQNYQVFFAWVGVEIVDILVVTVADNMLVTAFAWLILIGGLVCLATEGSLTKKIFCIVTYYVISSCLEVFFVYLMVLLRAASIPEIQADLHSVYILKLLVQIGQFVVLQCGNFIFSKKNGQIPVREAWTGVLLIPFACLCMLVLFAANMIKYGIHDSSYLLILLIILFINFMSYHFYGVMLKKHKLELQNRTNQLQLQAYENKIDEIIAKRRTAEKIRHDLGNQIAVLENIYSMAERDADTIGKVRQVHDSLEEIRSQYQMGVMLDTGNLSMDAIISLKLARARQCMIPVKTEIVVPGFLKYEAMELITVLGNLMDNAIEANLQLPANQREILLSIHYSMGNLKLRVENHYDGRLDGKKEVLSGEKGRILSTKNHKKHGMGIGNVMEVVERYQGTMMWTAGDYRFCVDVLLYQFFDEK